MDIHDNLPMFQQNLQHLDNEDFGILYSGLASHGNRTHAANYYNQNFAGPDGTVTRQEYGYLWNNVCGKITKG